MEVTAVNVHEMMNREELEIRNMSERLTRQAASARYTAHWGAISFNADPNKVVDELNSIGTSFSAKDVVNKARDPKTELHKCFEWNDAVAAEKYRESQARTVVGNLKITVIKGPSKQPEPIDIRYYSMASARGNYEPTEIIVRNQDKFDMLKEQALRELQTFRKKYAALNGLEAVFDAIDAVLANGNP